MRKDYTKKAMGFGLWALGRSRMPRAKSRESRVRADTRSGAYLDSQYVSFTASDLFFTRVQCGPARLVSHPWL